jgi:hypothetical protein
LRTRKDGQPWSQNGRTVGVEIQAGEGSHGAWRTTRAAVEPRTAGPLGGAAGNENGEAWLEECAEAKQRLLAARVRKRTGEPGGGRAAERGGAELGGGGVGVVLGRVGRQVRARDGAVARKEMKPSVRARGERRRG